MKKHKGIWIAVVLVVLAALIALLAWLNAPKGEVDGATLSIAANGETIHSFTMSEIQALAYIEVEKEIVSSSHSNDSGLFRCVSLPTLLSAAGAETGAAKQIVVRAVDGFVAAYSAEEALSGDGILLAYAKNGESLGDLESGGSGPFRIIIPEDAFGNRSAKYVFELELR